MALFDLSLFSVDEESLKKKFQFVFTFYPWTEPVVETGLGPGVSADSESGPRTSSLGGRRPWGARRFPPTQVLTPNLTVLTIHVLVLTFLVQIWGS